jgi:hypothetical protein
VLAELKAYMVEEWRSSSSSFLLDDDSKQPLPTAEIVAELDDKVRCYLTCYMTCSLLSKAMSLAAIAVLWNGLDDKAVVSQRMLHANCSG